MKRNLSLSLLLLLLSILSIPTKGQIVRKSITTDLLPEGTFTAGIEGPATDQAGNLYAVNYGKEGTIGMVKPDGSHACFLELPEGSIGNGIRFGKAGEMYIADYPGHTIWKVEMTTKAITRFAHEPRMNQPNDLAMAPNGTLYASDPNWAEESGQLWMITTEGKVLLLESAMGTTNGIEVSPDGNSLYVNESVQRRVWRYDIQPDGTVSNKRLFFSFEDYGMDGMRCDKNGNLYICRYDKGTVVILNEKGELRREIRLKGMKPTNITFGGADNRRCYVTMQDRGCFETFIAEYPGRE